MLGKKIPTIIALMVLIGIGIGVWIFLKSASPQVSQDIIPENVTVTNVADNKFSVSWTTAAATKGKLEYGSVGAALDKNADDDRGEQRSGRTHHVTVSQLQPDTQYAFRIMSGESLHRFDNQGSVYTVATGPTIDRVPAARSIYGEVTGSDDDTLAYISLPNAAPASTTLTSSGAYSLPISTMRSADLAEYVTYDPSATIVALNINNGLKKSEVTVSTLAITPVPTIALGVNADFRGGATPQVAQVEPAIAEPSPTPSLDTVMPGQIFNVEPIGNRINEVASKTYALLNPAVEGEVLATTKPEFRGTGVGNENITIAITGQKSVSDTVRIGATGEWKWSPAIALGIGKQKITVGYTDKDGKKQQIVRSFSVSNSTVTSEPAFVSTPSASVATASPSIRASATPSLSPSPRAAIPATDSGIPVTGVMAPTLLTAGLSFAIMVVGALLLAL